MIKNLIALLIFGVLTVSAQPKKTPDVFENGNIITLKGDTIFGFIKLPKNKLEIYQKVSLKDLKTNKVKPFLPEKIKGYTLGGYFYQSAYHNNKPCFFKVLSSGKATLYQIEYEINEEGQKHFVSDFCVSKQTKKGEEFILLEEKGLKKQLKDVFKPDRNLVDKISDTKEVLYNAETLEPLFKEYNSQNIN